MKISELEIKSLKTKTESLHLYKRQIISAVSYTIRFSFYLFKVNNGNSKIMCEISSRLTIKTPEQRQRRHSCYKYGHTKKREI